MYREAIRIGEKTLGREHSDVATSLNNLASLLKAQVSFGSENVAAKNFVPGKLSLKTDPGFSAF